RFVRRDWARGRALPLAQQVGHADEVHAGLRTQLLCQALLVAAENLERVGAISDPGPRLHQPADRIFQQRIEIEEHLRVTLHRRIVSDAAAAIHVLDQAIPETRLELGGPLVLPVLEGARTGTLEPVQESPQQREVLARAKAELLARCGEQLRRAQREEAERRRHDSPPILLLAGTIRRPNQLPVNTLCEKGFGLLSPGSEIGVSTLNAAPLAPGKSGTGPSAAPSRTGPAPDRARPPCR